MKNLLLLFAIVLRLVPTSAEAEDPHLMFVDAVIQSPVAPESSTIFIRTIAGDLSFVTGQSVPIQGRGDSWVIGGALQVSALGKDPLISFASFTSPTSVAYVPWQNLSLGSPSLFGGDPTILREQVLEMKGKVEGAQEKIHQALLEVEEAKRSVEGVEGGSMLRKYEFEAEALSAAKAGVESDCASLEHAVARMKLQPAPINAAKREVELQQQVALFAGLAKSAEVGEAARREQGEMDQEQARILIESTQDENEEELAMKLEQLRERRALLEDR